MLGALGFGGSILLLFFPRIGEGAPADLEPPRLPVLLRTYLCPTGYLPLSQDGNRYGAGFVGDTNFQHVRVDQQFQQVTDSITNKLQAILALLQPPAAPAAAPAAPAAPAAGGGDDN